MRNDLSSLVAAKMQATGLTMKRAAAQIGISVPALRATLRGRSTPNARTRKRWRKWLGSDYPQDETMISIPAKVFKVSDRLQLASKIIDDHLAVQVHKATPKQRRVLSLVLQHLSA